MISVSSDHFDLVRLEQSHHHQSLSARAHAVRYRRFVCESALILPFIIRESMSLERATPSNLGPFNKYNPNFGLLDFQISRLISQPI